MSDRRTLEVLETQFVGNNKQLIASYAKVEKENDAVINRMRKAWAGGFDSLSPAVKRAFDGAAAAAKQGGDKASKATNEMNKSIRLVTSEVNVMAQQFKAGIIGPEEFARTLKDADRELVGFAKSSDLTRTEVLSLERAVVTLDRGTKAYGDSLDEAGSAIEGMKNEVASLRNETEMGLLTDKQAIKAFDELKQAAMKQAEGLERNSKAYRELTQVGASSSRSIKTLRGEMTKLGFSGNTAVGITSALQNNLRGFGPAGNIAGMGFAKLTASLSASSAASESMMLRTRNLAVGISVGLVVAVAAASAALTKFAGEAGDWAAGLVHARERLNLTGEALQALRFAASTTSVEAGTLDGALQSLARRAASAAEGTGPAVKAYEKLGISVLDAGGKVKATDVLLGEIADGFTQLEDPAMKTALAFELFNRTGTVLLPMLAGGSEGLAGMAAEAERLGLVMSDVQLEDLENFGTELGIVKEQFAMLGRTMASEFLPYLRSDVIGFLQDTAIPAVRDFADTIKGLATLFNLSGGRVSAYSTKTLTMVASMASATVATKLLRVGITGIGAAVGVALPPMRLLGLAVGAITLAVAGISRVISEMSEEARAAGEAVAEFNTALGNSAGRFAPVIAGLKQLEDATGKAGLTTAVHTLAETLEGDGKDAFVVFATQAIASGKDIQKVTRLISEELIRQQQKIEMHRFDTGFQLKEELERSIASIEERLGISGDPMKQLVPNLSNLGLIRGLKAQLENDQEELAVVKDNLNGLVQTIYDLDVAAGSADPLSVLQATVAGVGDEADEAAGKISGYANSINGLTEEIQALAEVRDETIDEEVRKDAIEQIKLLEERRKALLGDVAASAKAKTAAGDLAGAYGSLKWAQDGLAEASKALSLAPPEMVDGLKLARDEWQATFDAIQEGINGVEDPLAALRLWTARLGYELSEGRNAFDVAAILTPKFNELKDELRGFWRDGLGDTDAADTVREQIALIESVLIAANSQMTSAMRGMFSGVNDVAAGVSEAITSKLTEGITAAWSNVSGVISGLKEFESAERLASLLGEDFDDAAVRAGILEAEIKGLNESYESLNWLQKRRLQLASEELAAIRFQQGEEQRLADSLKAVTASISDLGDSLKPAADGWRSFTSIMQDVNAATGEAEGPFSKLFGRIDDLKASVPALIPFLTLLQNKLQGLVDTQAADALEDAVAAATARVATLLGVPGVDPLAAEIAALEGLSEASEAARLKYAGLIDSLRQAQTLDAFRENITGAAEGLTSWVQSGIEAATALGALRVEANSLMGLDVSPMDALRANLEKAAEAGGLFAIVANRVLKELNKFESLGANLAAVDGFNELRDSIFAMGAAPDPFEAMSISIRKVGAELGLLPVEIESLLSLLDGVERDEAIEALGEQFEGAREAVEALADTSVNEFEVLRVALYTVKDGMEALGLATTEVDDALALLGDAEELSQLADAADAFTAKLNEVREALREVGRAAGGAFGTMLSGVDDLIGAFEAGGLLGTLKSIAVTGLGSIVSAISSLINKNKEWEASLDKLSGRYRKLSKDVTDAIAVSKQEPIKLLFWTIGSKTVMDEQATQQGIDWAMSFVGSIENALKGTDLAADFQLGLDQMIQNELITGFLRSAAISEAITGIVELFRDAWAEEDPGVRDAMILSARSAYGTMQDDMEGFYDFLKENFPDLYSEFVSGFAGALSTIRSIGVPALTAVESSAKGLMDMLKAGTITAEEYAAGLKELGYAQDRLDAQDAAKAVKALAAALELSADNAAQLSLGVQQSDLARAFAEGALGLEQYGDALVATAKVEADLAREQAKRDLERRRSAALEGLEGEQRSKASAQFDAEADLIDARFDASMADAERSASDAIRSILGVTTEGLSSSLRSAFDNETFAGFVSDFEDSMHATVRNALILGFLESAAMKPLLDELGKMIADATKDGLMNISAEDLAAITAQVDLTTEAGREFFKFLELIGFGFTDLTDDMSRLGDSIQKVNDEFLNVPTLFKVRSATWDAAPVRSSWTPDGSGTSSTTNVYIEHHGDVIGIDDFEGFIQNSVRQGEELGNLSTTGLGGNT